MAGYAKDKDLKDTILIESPVSSNYPPPPKIDDYFLELLEERRRKHDLNHDAVLERIQTKVRNIIGTFE